jgi:hypothetical protein
VKIRDFKNMKWPPYIPQILVEKYDFKFRDGDFVQGNIYQKVLLSCNISEKCLISIARKELKELMNIRYT